MPLPDDRAAYKQHAVPQNIMDVEFKLIGDLTMRQFIYLLVFGLIAYLIYISVFGLFKWPLVTIFILLGLGLAFVPIQERGMDEWFVNFFRSVYSPTQMVWQKEPVLPSAFTYDSLALVKQEMITLAPTSSRRKLEEYLEMQQGQQEEDALDIPEREYILKVRQAYAPVATEIDISSDSDRQEYIPQYEQEYRIGAGPKTQQVQQPGQMADITSAQQGQSGPQDQADQQDQIDQPDQPDQQGLSLQEPSEAQAVLDKMKREQEEAKMGFSDFIKSRLAADTSKKEDAKKLEESISKPKPQVKRKPQKPKLPRSMTDDIMLSPITPDRHIGRRFTHMTSAEGQLILPVRGEKIIETSEELDIQRDIDEKAAQLNKLLGQIKGDIEIKRATKPKEDVGNITEKKEEISGDTGIDKAKDVVKEVKEQNERLSNEIQRIKGELEKGKSLESDEVLKKKQDELKRLEEEKQKKGADYSSLQKQLHELQRRLKEKEDPTSVMVSAQPIQPTYAKMQPITKEPNIVSGIVRKENNEALPNIVLLIKNNKGEPVRGIKTNTLGQFSLSTPLVNGLYTLEVDPNAGEGFSFDIITVEVKGDVIPPIELVGVKAK